jgi:replicative superfamily II helicase
MQLTKAEIAETQIIVTTPEKWDVVTRKPTGEGELASVRIQRATAVFVVLIRAVVESQTSDYR